MGMEIPDEDVEEMAANADMDGDGVLGIEEFEDMVKKMIATVREQVWLDCCSCSYSCSYSYCYCYYQPYYSSNSSLSLLHTLALTLTLPQACRDLSP